MSELVFEKLTQPLLAGASWPVTIAGSFFRLGVCQWPVTVRLLRMGRIVGKMDNMLAGDYVKDMDFDGIEVINGTVAQSVSIQIAGGAAGSDRVLGEVSVIDGAMNTTLAGTAFGGYSNNGALAGQFSHAQLWNPVGSGKNVVVSCITMGTNAANMPFHLRLQTAACVTLAGNGSNKRAGGAASLAEIRGEQNAALLGVALNAFYCTVYQPFVYRPEEPIILPPGYGISVAAGVVNQSALGSFEWKEI